MRARLIIRFGSEPGHPAQWLALDAAGAAVGAPGSGSLAEAAAAARGHTVIGLLPGFDVLLLAARIPTQSRQKLLQALPYALEDQLADDVEELHFVPGRRDSEGRLAVAVIARARLQEWLDACTEADLDLDQAYPEILALPHESGAWTLLLEKQGFLLRTGPQSGFAGDSLNVRPLLESALEEADEPKPERLKVYGGTDLAVLEGLAVEIEQPTPERALPLMARHLDPRHAINLRSGPFARSRSLGGNWRRWYAVAALFIAWVAVDTGAALLQQWRHQAELNALNSEIHQLYRQAFPGAAPPHVLAMRSTVENRLRALRGGGTVDSGLLDLLARVGPTLGDPAVQLTALNYRNGEIELEFSAENLQTVDQLQQKLNSLEGVAAEVRNARAEGERAIGRLRIGAS
jgi:general secretion pathway protein L